MDRLPTYDPFDVDEVQEANEYYVSLVDEGGKFPQLRIRAGAGSRKNMTLTGTSQIVCVSYGNFDCWHTGGSLVQAVDTRTGTMTRTIQLEALPDLQSMIATRHDAALTDYGHESTPLSREIQSRVMPLRGRRRSRKGRFSGLSDREVLTDFLVSLPLARRYPITRVRPKCVTGWKLPSHAQASTFFFTSEARTRNRRQQISLDRRPVERLPDELSSMVPTQYAVALLTLRPACSRPASTATRAMFWTKPGRVSCCINRRRPEQYSLAANSG